MSDRLNKVQKALGDYLNAQRVAFPRFYFVGDDDLLEVVGSRDPSKVQQHLNKIFSGIKTLRLDVEGRAVVGMISKEGEIVDFLQQVVMEDRKIHEWMTLVENQMRFTLGQLLIRGIFRIVSCQLYFSRTARKKSIHAVFSNQPRSNNDFIHPSC